MIAKKRAEKPEVRKASREAALREVRFVGLNLAQLCVAFAVVIVAKVGAIELELLPSRSIPGTGWYVMIC